MSLASGEYLILNAGSDNRYLTLPKKDGILTGAPRSGSNNQKWIINILDDDTYHISNSEDDAQLYASASAGGRGSTIRANETAEEWRITELKAGTYRISKSMFAWSLGTENITLQRMDRDDESQSWKLQLPT